MRRLAGIVWHCMGDVRALRVIIVPWHKWPINDTYAYNMNILSGMNCARYRNGLETIPCNGNSIVLIVHRHRHRQWAIFWKCFWRIFGYDFSDFGCLLTVIVCELQQSRMDLWLVKSTEITVATRAKICDIRLGEQEWQRYFIVV